ncbi:MAG: AroM family protein [Clostridia bacterium]|nr:AroM family protein [Clostridia bacterium]
MGKFNVGLIRVITLKDQKQLQVHSDILNKYFNDFCITTKCIEGQPEGIHDDNTEEQAIPKIIEIAKKLESQGQDIILISCAADPAVQECRKLLHIPVVGAGSSAAALAVGTGDNIGVVGITQQVPDVIKRILGDKFKFYIKPEGISNTLDLYKNGSKSNILQACESLKDMGCDGIVLACTGMSTIGIRMLIEKEIGLKVIDPVLAAGIFIEYFRLSR